MNEPPMPPEWVQYLLINVVKRMLMVFVTYIDEIKEARNCARASGDGYLRRR